MTELSIPRESTGDGNGTIGRRFRILALDGGGIKGTFTAAVLAEWERSTGLRIAEHFDLIAGTSTGGILAIGLGIGLSAADLLDFYERRGPVIFPTTGFGRKYWRSVHQVMRPKYAGEVLHNELRAAFKDAQFGDSKVRLLIPAYDILRARLFLFKTAHSSRFTHDIEIPAADVALATAAAPTYFQAAKIAAHADQGYVDGGVWANCPALAAVVESVSFLGKRLEDLDIVSIGTTFAPDSVKTLSGAGLFGWAPRIVNLLMNAQAEAARVQASLLVGGDRFPSHRHRHPPRRIPPRQLRPSQRARRPGPQQSRRKVRPRTRSFPLPRRTYSSGVSARSAGRLVTVTLEPTRRFGLRVVIVADLALARGGSRESTKALKLHRK